MKIIYLAAFRAFHPGRHIVYQDIDGKRDIAGDMLDVDLSYYDVVIATPPCNYYSRANYRRSSEYSQKTKYLLPSIIHKLSILDKPFIVENVRSSLINEVIKNSPSDVFVYQHGRHTYWTNILFNPSCIVQTNENLSNLSKSNRQGGNNVHDVFEYWLDVVQEVLK